MMKRFLALTLALALALTACAAPAADSSAQPSAGPSAAPGPQASAPVEVDLTKTMCEYTTGLADGDTAITVNGTLIDNATLLYWLGYNCNYILTIYQAYYGITPDFSDPAQAAPMLQDAQNTAIYHAILHQLCEERGVELTDEQRAAVQAELGQLAEEDKAKLLKAWGMSEDAFYQVNISGLLYENLVEAVIGAPTDQQIAQYISDNGVFGVKHILLSTVTADLTDEEGNVTQTAGEYNAQRKALAEDLLSQLQQADDMPALFDTLMNEHSEDGRDTEGNLAAPDGYTFSSADSLVDGFREAALELEEGQMSGIVETDYGYHILLRLPVERADVEADCAAALAAAFITEATEASDITVADHVAAIDVGAFFQAFNEYMSAVYQ